MASSSATTRRPRADRVRNRERVLEAATMVFQAGGPEASLEAVARRAGVGIATLYRHFPTRDALFEAVYRREVEQLAALAEQDSPAAPPLQAMRDWLHACLALVATKKGMSAALAVALHPASPLVVAYSGPRLTGALALLLRRAVDAGEVCADITAEELLRTVIGLCSMYEAPGWQSSVVRLLDVFLEGMRHQTA